MKRFRSLRFGLSSVWVRCALVFAGVWAGTAFIRASFVENALQLSLVEPTGINASPFLIFGMLLCIYAWSLNRDDLKRKTLQWPSFDQAFPALLFWALTLIVAVWVSHPAQAIFARMQLYALIHPEAGAPFIAGLISLVELLPAIPILLFFFPLPALIRSRGRLIGGSILLVLYGMGPVIEASYYRLVGPPLVTVVRGLLFLIPGTIPPNLNRWEIGYGSFKVTLGYACTDFSALMLFIGLFGLVWWQMTKKRRIDHAKAMIALACGIIALWILNVLRITLIVLIGSVYPAFALTLFHSAVGIVIFLCFFLAYVKVVLPMVVAMKNKGRRK